MTTTTTILDATDLLNRISAAARQGLVRDSSMLEQRRRRASALRLSWRATRRPLSDDSLVRVEVAVELLNQLIEGADDVVAAPLRSAHSSLTFQLRATDGIASR